MTTTDTPQPWEQQPEETEKAYAAFCVYRDLGAVRSIEKASQKLAKSVPLLKRWSVDNAWVERVAAYDTYMDSERQKELLQTQKDIIQNALSDYHFMREVIENRMELYRVSGFKAESHEFGNLLEIMKKADDLARRAVGLPDKISESKTDITSKGERLPVAIIKMDVDEL